MRSDQWGDQVDGEHEGRGIMNVEEHKVGERVGV